MLIEIRLSDDGRTALLFAEAQQACTDGRHWMSLQWIESANLTVFRYSDADVDGWEVLYRKDSEVQG